MNAINSRTGALLILCIFNPHFVNSRSLCKCINFNLYAICALMQHPLSSCHFAQNIQNFAMILATKLYVCDSVNDEHFIWLIVSLDGELILLDKITENYGLLYAGRYIKIMSFS